MPSEYRAEAIIDAIGIEKIRGARILIPRAQVAREELPEMLRERGAAEVVVAPAYKTIAPSGVAIDRMRESLASSGYDLVAFTSSSTASNYVEMVGKPNPGAKAAAIGPITASTAEQAGFRGGSEASRIHHSGIGGGHPRLLRVHAWSDTSKDRQRHWGSQRPISCLTSLCLCAIRGDSFDER